MEVTESFMQQVQEKQQVKIQQPIEQPVAFRQSVLPTALSVASKACYGLSGASILLSVSLWSRVSVRLPRVRIARNAKKAQKPAGKKAGFSWKLQAQKSAKKAVKAPKATKQQIRSARRNGLIVSACAPTLAVAGKLLGDASNRIAKHEFAQWEKKQAEKARSHDFRARFFAR
jgi:uncharacterized membrane protein (DUF4010 family)